MSSKADAFEREEVDDLRTLAGMMAPALDNAIQHRKVDDLSRTDGLTGLLNHRTFQLIFDGKINSMGRYGQSMAVVMVDADKFKAVNDTYGHSVGDEVLVELSKRLKSLVRKNDAVARYVYRRTQDRHASEDIIADVFLSAYRGFRRARRTNAPVLFWLLRIATNRVHGWLKKTRHQDEVVDGGADLRQVAGDHHDNLRDNPRDNDARAREIATLRAKFNQ